MSAHEHDLHLQEIEMSQTGAQNLVTPSSDSNDSSPKRSPSAKTSKGALRESSYLHC